MGSRLLAQRMPLPCRFPVLFLLLLLSSAGWFQNSWFAFLLCGVIHPWILSVSRDSVHSVLRTLLAVALLGFLESALPA